MLESAVMAGLLASGCEVISVGIASTPATAFMVRHHRAAGGVVITASHNPIIWNGIKFLTDEGLAPPPERAETLFGIYRDRTFQFVDAEKVFNPASDSTASTRHVEATLAIVESAAIGRKRFRVVLDSVNGAGGEEGRMLLERLGCEVVHINSEPSGRFAHTPEPLAENLTQLCDAVREHEAVAGFAQDPDADRLAIVDETGRYIGEEYTLALTAKYLFAHRPGAAAANLSTSRMIDDLALAAGGGCRVLRSAVGEANVVATMKAHGCMFGGEGNGGVIDPRVGVVRDSLVAMALVLQLMTTSRKTISGLVGEIPAYTMIKTKFECSKERINAVLAAVKRRYHGERINDVDGVRIDFTNGWVHVRGSNTEPIIRIIAEASTRERANNLIADVRAIADSC